ncbi:MAG: MSEP-CTERM sorting domain-containing protein, partial [Flavobacteriales bacterium]
TQVVLPFRPDPGFERHAWVVALAALTIAFLFLLIRVVAAILMRGGRFGALAHLARVVIALVLPLTGLAVNNGLLPVAHGAGAFGDLSHPAFYIIALANAAAVIWPSSPSPATRTIQFSLRAAGFSYVCYFFVLFVPLLPASLLAAVALGAGFLLLAPVLLFALQGALLWRDARYLLSRHSRASLAAIFLAAFLSVPFAIVIGMLQDRSTLRAMLRHAYQYDPREHPIQPLDTAATARVLRRIEANRHTARWRPGRPLPGHTPFITPLYNRIVLGNLTLGQKRADQLARIFLDRRGTGETSGPRGANPGGHTTIDSLWGESRYDEEQQAWRSWVHLLVRNDGEVPEELAADIALPEGAWVSDHYLVMEGDTAKGILAEKKAALWVYNSIVSE